jgi:hypothetical protein
VSHSSADTGRAASAPTVPNSPLLYRLKLKTEVGALLREERVRADTDAEAIGLAMRRLAGAAIVEVWRHARWVAQVQRTPVVH